MNNLLKFLTVGRVFVILLAVIFGTLLWSNSDTILTRLGMETKTTLSKKVGELNQTVHTLEWMNADNVREIERLKEDNERLLKALKELEVERTKIEDKANKVQKDLKDKTAQLKDKILKEQKLTETTLTLPRQEVEQLSHANISALHSAYNELFPSQPEPSKGV